MTNRGVYPLDPNTTVGQFRVLYPDRVSVPLVPPEAGFADYAELSDEDIESFLAMSGDSVFKAIGNYYLSLAGQAAKESKVVKDADLSVSLTERAKDLRAVADDYFDRATAEAVASGELDIFDSFRFNGDEDYYAEDAAYPLEY